MNNNHMAVIETLGMIMKILISTILILLGAIQIVVGQSDFNEFEDWDKIIIIDGYGGWSYFHNEFQIEKNTLSLSYTDNPDSVIKTIDPTVVNALLKSFTTSKDFITDPLKIFGKDSLWLINNAEELWKEYNKDKGQSNEIDSIAINQLKDYEQVKKVVWSLQGSHWTDDYPFTQISIIKGQDTLFVN